MEEKVIELDNQESYQVWMKKLKAKSRRGEVSRAMINNYNSSLRQFVNFVRGEEGGDGEATPDTIMEWARSTEPEKVIDLLNDFENWIQGKEIEGHTKRKLVGRKKYPLPLSATQKAHGVLRGFFTHNGLMLPASGKKTSGKGKAKKNDENHSVFKINNETKSIVKDYSEFKMFLSQLTNRDTTIALCLISTGQDSGDLLKLNIGFVSEQAKRDRLYWSGERTKTVEPFRTFFSEEATEYVRRYIAQERKGAADDESIFVIGKQNKSGETTKVKRITSSHLGANYLTAAKALGLNGSSQSPYRPKRLRSIFSEACYQAGIDDALRHQFMGHRASISEGYREVPVSNLEMKYAIIEPWVTIFTDDQAVVVKKAQEKSEKALDLALDLRQANKDMKIEIEQLNKKVEDFVKMVGNLEELSGRVEAMEEYLKGLDEEVNLSDHVETTNQGEEYIVVKRRAGETMKEAVDRAMGIKEI